MIKAMFKHRKEDNSLLSFELTGHAGAGEEGQDIVCAAVSALAVTTVNGIEQLIGVPLVVDVDEENGGYLYATLREDLTDEQWEKSQLLLANFYLGMCDIEKDYYQYVNIQNT